MLGQVAHRSKSTFTAGKLVGGLCACLLISCASLFAIEPKVETVMEGLADPFGVAVQPETGIVFVAESGAGKIIRLVNGKAEDVVTGSPTEKNEHYTLGPLGIAFFDQQTLVVGDGGYPIGEDCVRTFVIPEAGKTLDYEKNTHSKSGPLGATSDRKAEGDFYSLAVSPTGVYVTCNGDSDGRWIGRIEINGTKFGQLERFIPTSKEMLVRDPRSITLSPRGEIVVGQRYSAKTPKDNRLSFFSHHSGKKLLTLTAELYSITGLAYHPKTGLLYALDAAWPHPQEGGLYRLDRALKGTELTIQATKIVALDQPTALSFTPDGTLYVTTLGNKKTTDQKFGQLLKIALP